MNSPFDALDHVEPGVEARLRARLIEAAEEQGLLDLTYITLDTPLGRLMLVASARGLLRVAYEREGHEVVLERLANVVSPRILHTPQRLDVVRRQIDEYFEGDRRTFDLQLDLHLAKGFRRVVLDHLLDIHYGETQSYAQVADAAGNPERSEQ
ncbi:hypothetical protein GCM10029964_076130 [Kibdelosporangium lantanae]